MAAAISKHKPAVVEKIVSPSVGEFLTEVKTKSGLRPKTFKSYANCLRKIVADILGIEGGKHKFDYRGGGQARWRQAVDTVKLDTLTPDKIQAWKVAYLDRARSNPLQLVRAKRSVNSFMRQAKCLFSPKISRFLSGINLPTPLPFAGIEFERTGSMRYQGKIDYRSLVAAARDELSVSHPEQYKIFLLALGAGLRRAEIDTLTWGQIDWENATIWIGPTEYFTPKTEDSQGTVDVDPGLLAALRYYQPSHGSDFVINSTQSPRPNSSYQYYRAGAEFDQLNAWLRKQGVTAQKPLHELRKEFGSLVCQQAGIYAASTQLRHGDIRVTASFYLAKRERVTVKLH